MALWTPANLAITPKVILDPSVASWSGSNWGSTANIGTGGGNIVASTGTPVKGTKLNGLDTVLFNNNSLTLASQNWTAGADLVIFAILNCTDHVNGNGLFAMGWDFATAQAGMVFYPRAMTSGTVSPTTDTWAIDDVLSFSQGFGDGAGAFGYMIISQPFVDSAYHIMSYRSGATRYFSFDGTLTTPSGSSASTPVVQTNVPMYFGESHGSNVFGEQLAGTVAYLAVIPGNVTTSEYQKLEGWGAWKYGLVSKLPVAHPYKNFAPFLSYDPLMPKKLVFM